MAKAALRPAPPLRREPEPAPPPAEAEKPEKKGRGKLFWIGLLLISIAGGGASWVMISDPATAGAQPQKAEKPPIFVNLETFTVNLQQELGEQYLQVTLTVKATDEAVADSMKLHMPEIRNRLLLLLSSKRPSELLTVPGKLQLADEILGEVKKPVPEPLREHVAAVYFTAFVIQ